MLHNLKSHAKAHKTFIASVMISLLLHTLLLSEFSFTLPKMDEDSQQLNVHLVQATAPAVASKPLTKLAAKPKTETINSFNTEHTNTENAETVENISTPAEDTLDFPAANELEAAETPKETAEVKPTDMLTPPEPLGAKQENAAIKPQYIETEFEVFQGDNKSVVGTARTIFNIDKSASYVIKSVIEAQGLTALFFQNLVQESQGVVTEHGLKPSYYFYRYGNKKSQTANFHWDDGTVTMRTEKGEKTERLETGTQDLLSFMYQFMFTPPLENNVINITNGKNLKTYTYTSQGEELLNTKFGNLNTIRLLRKQEDGSTEVWLATDYYNLPVKIRKIEKNGSIIDQTISKISTHVSDYNVDM